MQLNTYFLLAYTHSSLLVSSLIDTLDYYSDNDIFELWALGCAN